MTHSAPSPRLHRAEHRDPSTARALQRAARSDRLVRIRPGVYVDRAAWSALDPAGRHRTLARAVAPTLTASMSFSHTTAAVLRGWPLLGAEPDRIMVVDAASGVTRHRAGILVRAGQPSLEPSAMTFAGVAVTSATDTALGVVMTEPRDRATVLVGHAVREGAVDRERLLAAIPDPPERNAARARRVVEHTDLRHESVGEDLTAARLADLGIERVVPQHVFRSSRGFLGRVDFWLPELGVVVEFDGRTKYTDPSMLDGRDPADVVWREKIREDTLRSLDAVRTVIRPRWRHVVELDRFRALFREHGIVLPR